MRIHALLIIILLVTSNVTVQIHAQPTPPVLNITRAPTNSVLVSWSSNDERTWHLEESPTLSVPRWITSPSGSNTPVTLDLSQSAKFFRLVLAPTNMVWIPPGTFTMGSPTTDPAREPNEEPQTQVTLSQGFWIGKYEVTQREYMELMPVNPSESVVNPAYPVDNLIFDEAEEYCFRLTFRERNLGNIPAHYRYRLPTEAEWEYACRAGTTTRFSYGEDPDYSELDQYAWYLGNSTSTHISGLKKPNPWGLYDMHGNLWEWCQDWHDLYPGGSVTDPTGPADGVAKVLRGASWLDPFVSCRSALRSRYVPEIRCPGIGMRVVLSGVVP